jgi:type II secretory pathway pseudopilin PulG
MKKRGMKAQVWIETVIYTLIGLVIMGTIITVMTPRIAQMSDKVIIEQTIEALNQFDEQLRDTLPYAGNQREILLTIKKGEYTINAVEDVIYFSLKNTGLKYSEPNESFKQGEIEILTLDKGNRKYDIRLLLNYSNYNLTYQNTEMSKVLTASPTAYKLLIINKDGKKIEIEPV